MVVRTGYRVRQRRGCVGKKVQNSLCLDRTTGAWSICIASRCALYVLPRPNSYQRVSVIPVLPLIPPPSSTVLQGCGKQRYGLYINLAVFYCVAVPLALYLGFVRHLGVVGMWLGMLAGPVMQVGTGACVLASVLTSVC